MIYTLTLNPCIDKTVELDRLERGALNRIKGSRLDAAGKGINVSSVLKIFGVESIPIAVAAGDSGRYIENVLSGRGFAPKFIWVDGETRTNLKVIEPDGTLTEINEPGPFIDEYHYSHIIETLHRLVKTGDTLVVSGSLPPGIPKTFYRDMTDVFTKLGARVVIDADGEALSLAIGASPYIVKPNLFELESLTGNKLIAEEEILQAVAGLLDTGVENAVVSLGEEGAVFASKAGCCWAKSSKIEPRSTVGCGDTLLGAFLAGIFEGKAFDDCCRLALSAATAKALKEGTQLPDIGEIDAVKELVKMKGFTLQR